MTRFTKFLLVVVVATAAAVGVSGQAFAAQECANADVSTSDLTQEDAEAAVLCLVNVERANAGLAPLTYNRELADAARAHANAAVELQWWDSDADWHTNPITGSQPQDRMQEAGYCADGQLTRAAENTYWAGSSGDGATAPTPADGVNAWMNSPGHRANILDENLTELGVGVVLGAPAAPAPDAAAVFVQNFGTCTTTTTPAPTCADADTSTGDLTQEDAEAAVLCLVNVERANAGLAPLTYNRELADAARAHANAAVELQWWDSDADWHTNPITGSQPQDRMQEAGYCADGQLTRAAENTYWAGSSGDGATAPTPADGVNAWMNSPGHRANILDENLTELGVGVVLGAPAAPAPDAAAVFVQNFGTCTT